MSLKYKVTVDGMAYSVEVEELSAGAAAPFAGVPVASAPAPNSSTSTEYAVPLTVTLYFKLIT